jgi:hypothetical protein
LLEFKRNQERPEASLPAGRQVSFLIFGATFYQEKGARRIHKT